MKITKELLSEIFDWYIEDLHEARVDAKFAEDYFSAFQAGTLDIEGYELKDKGKRKKEKGGDGWRKLDGDDSKTYPQKTGDYLVFWKSGMMSVQHFLADECCFDECDVSDARFWRENPLKLPVVE